MSIITNTNTYKEAEEKKPKFAVLPIGSFEQHGYHLPMITDTIIASVLAKGISDQYNGFLLPPITFSCSHEHDGFFGTISISSNTLSKVVKDIFYSLQRSNIYGLVIVNAHGGNYILNNLAQEENINGPRIILLPTRKHWNEAYTKAELEMPREKDMHAGEKETSILLDICPEFVRNTKISDVNINDNSYLHLYGIKSYSQIGTVGFPSLASSNKGEIMLSEIVNSVNDDILNFIAEVTQFATQSSSMDTNLR